ncbi:hypothetical protein OG216_29885 [Streptomycetaceae bacterium NBC_01309]
MRNGIRIAFAVLALYLFWKFQNTSIGQGSFIVAAVGLFVDEWFMSQVRGGRTAGTAAHPGPAGRVQRPAGSAGYADPWGSAPSGRGPTEVGTVATIFVTSLILAIMADSFFYTTWLELPEDAESSGGGGLMTVIKIIASLLALAVAFLAPIFVGVFVYIEIADSLGSRAFGGCAALLAAVVVVAVSYAHFGVAYLFYEELGVLRPHG